LQTNIIIIHLKTLNIYNCNCLYCG